MRTGFKLCLHKNPALLSLLLALLAILFVNPLGNFPLNDDWQYAYPVKTWLEGDLTFKGVFAPNILLQVGWGYLFCNVFGSFDFTWLRFSTLILAMAAALVFAALCRRAGLEKRSGIFGAWALGLNPLFFSLAFSFMSDVPFLALCLLSLFSFYVWLQHQKTRWLCLACLWAVAAFYVRQPGIIFLPAFALFILWQKHFTIRGWLTAALLIAFAAAVFFSFEKIVKPALDISKNYVPVGDKYYTALAEKPFETLSEWAKKGMKTVVYLGFFGLPLLPFLWQKMKRLRLFTPKKWAAVLILNAALLLFFIKIGKTFPFGGNILFNFGLGPELLGDVYTLGLPNTPRLPEAFMLALQFVSQVAATFFILLIVKAFQQLSPLNRQFACLLLLLNAIYLPLLSITSFFDRYLLLPIACFFFVLLQLVDADELRVRSFRWLPFLLMSLFSLFATKDYMSWNRAKNQAFNYLISEGVSIREMDAGYEYNGFYNYHSDYEAIESRSFWWVEDDEWMIAFGQVPGHEMEKTFPYRRWLFFRNDAILVLRRR